MWSIFFLSLPFDACHSSIYSCEFAIYVQQTLSVIYLFGAGQVIIYTLSRREVYIKDANLNTFIDSIELFLH